jgi:hypothetical protein
MRLALPLAVLILAGCSVDNDPGQDRVTVQYDEERIKKTAADTGRAAKVVATGAANVAKGTAQAIKKEVGDVDVNVKVSRTPSEPGR